MWSHVLSIGHPKSKEVFTPPGLVAHRRSSCHIVIGLEVDAALADHQLAPLADQRGQLYRWPSPHLDEPGNAKVI